METSDFVSQGQLETERLWFRPLTATDASLLFQLDSDPRVMRFISRGKPTPRHQIETEILPRWLRVRKTDVRLGFWMAYEKDTDAFAGWFSLKHEPFDPRIELGYRLRQACWGRGLATEGGRRLVRYAFDEANFRELTSHTLKGNQASQRVLEKCGFCFEQAFVYPANLLPGWAVEERRAMRYGITQQAGRRL